MHRLFESSRGESSFVGEQGEHLVHCVALRYITCYNPLVMIVYLRARASQRSLSGNRNWKVLIEKSHIEGWVSALLRHASRTDRTGFHGDGGSQAN